MNFGGYKMENFSEKNFIRDIYESEKYKYILTQRKEEITRKIENDKKLIESKKERLLEEASLKFENEKVEVEKLPKKLKNVNIDHKKHKMSTSERIKDSISTAILDLFYENGWLIVLVLSIVMGLIGKYTSIPFGFWVSFLISTIIVSVLFIFVYSIICYFESFSIEEKVETTIQEEVQKKIEIQNRIEEQKKHNSENKKNHKKEIAEINNNAIQELALYNAGQETIYLNEINNIETSLENINKTLDDLYSFRVNDILCLHPSYQGLLPVSVIYGYFDTGRCNKLAGADGAYNLYEDEKFKGMLLNKLDVISVQLNSLNRTMYYTGLAIQECNNKLTQLNNSTNKMIDSLSNMNENVLLLDDKISENDLKRTQEIEKLLKTNENIAYYTKTNAKINALNAMYNSGKDKFSFDTDMKTYRNVWIENY